MKNIRAYDNSSYVCVIAHYDGAVIPCLNLVTPATREWEKHAQSSAQVSGITLSNYAKVTAGNLYPTSWRALVRRGETNLLGCYI